MMNPWKWHDDVCWKPRSATGYRVHVWCRACRHAKAADLAALVDAAAVTCR
jgi:hypothetical protein